MKKRILIALVMVLTLAALGGSVAADPAILVVDDDGTYDAVTNSCDGTDTTYASIQAAVGAANPGDTVFVCAGTYYEHITMKSGVTIQGAGADVTTIDGSSSGTVVTAVYVDSAANLDGFTITNGSADYGGGMLNQGSSPTVTNCTFSGNSASRWGGGMLNREGSSPTVTNCTFSGNSAFHGGGMLNHLSSPTVTNCTFSGNSASHGAGMLNWDRSSPTVTNCTFSGNSAHYLGGGMFNDYSSSPTVTNCAFSGNSAGHHGGGMFNGHGSYPTVTNCTFSGNSAGYGGGGMCNDGSSPTVTNCTFSDNSASYGGGMSNFSGSSPTVTNCILWGNGDDLYGCTATYSDIEDGDPGEGNISQDPLFVDPGAGDYHLRSGSPCIDAGSNALVPSWLTTDFEGDPRILDGDRDGLAVVDMGADEAPVPPYNTPVGTDVTVVATDPETGEPTPVTVTFSEVTAGGDTTATTSPTGPPVPTSFQLGNPPTYFDITTTAEYDPPVTVCINYSGITFQKDESELGLLQKIETGWIDVTLLPVDIVNNIICGEVPSLSWFTIAEPNYPPTAHAGDPYSVDEGGSVVVEASGSDPEGDPVIFAWDLDNDGTFETPGQSVTFSAAALDGPSSQTITVQVTDSLGLAATDQTTVEILNVAPTVDPITAPADPVQVNTEINASADFTDPGTMDTHTAVWDWGDSTTSPGTVTESGGSGSVVGTHMYTAAGVYTINLTVTDDGGVGSAQFEFVVVYDPEGGFVTGGGWIDSPEGAYAPDPSLTGKATFGFVSKYKKGATVPTGQTEFQFRVADLDFHSTTYQWLVIAGPRAQYKGSGTINGEGDYGFMLTAIDENLTPSTDVDLFRIKIWDKGTDSVVYDNKAGEPDSSDLATVLGGGSIVIHKK